ncbi:hypothetical protein ACOMHN_026923 [Nucella lapillus]
MFCRLGQWCQAQSSPVQTDVLQAGAMVSGTVQSRHVLQGWCQAQSSPDGCSAGWGNGVRHSSVQTDVLQVGAMVSGTVQSRRMFCRLGQWCQAQSSPVQTDVLQAGAMVSGTVQSRHVLQGWGNGVRHSPVQTCSAGWGNGVRHSPVQTCSAGWGNGVRHSSVQTDVLQVGAMVSDTVQSRRMFCRLGQWCQTQFSPDGCSAGWGNGVRHSSVQTDVLQVGAMVSGTVQSRRMFCRLGQWCQAQSSPVQTDVLQAGAMVSGTVQSRHVLQGWGNGVRQSPIQTCSAGEAIVSDTVQSSPDRCSAGLGQWCQTQSSPDMFCRAGAMVSGTVR